MNALCPLLVFREFDNMGLPLAGGRVWTFEAGTATQKTTWADAVGSAVNTNPVILDSAGRANIYLSGYYRFQVEDADGVILYTVDNVTASASGGGGGGNNLNQTEFYGPDFGVDPNTFVVDIGETPDVYTDGLCVIFRASQANTGDSTLNFNGIGAAPIVKPMETGFSSLVTGDIIAGQMVSVIYDEVDASWKMRQSIALKSVTVQTKVSADDTTLGYLEDKIVVSVPLQKTILNPAGNEQIRLSVPVGHNGGFDADTVDGRHAENAANGIPVLSGTGFLPLSIIPATLTGKDADSVDGRHVGTTDGTIPVLGPGGTLPLARIPTSLVGISADLLDGFHASELQMLAQKNVSGGYCGLNSSGRVDVAQLGGAGAFNNIDVGWVGGYNAASLEKIANKGAANGYCGLSGGYVPLANIPLNLTGVSADLVDGLHAISIRNLCSKAIPSDILEAGFNEGFGLNTNMWARYAEPTGGSSMDVDTSTRWAGNASYRHYKASGAIYAGSIRTAAFACSPDGLVEVTGIYRSTAALHSMVYVEFRDASENFLVNRVLADFTAATPERGFRGKVISGIPGTRWARVVLAGPDAAQVAEGYAYWDGIQIRVQEGCADETYPSWIWPANGSRNSFNYGPPFDIYIPPAVTTVSVGFTLQLMPGDSNGQVIGHFILDGHPSTTTAILNASNATTFAYSSLNISGYANMQNGGLFSLQLLTGSSDADVGATVSFGDVHDRLKAPGTASRTILFT